MRSGGEEGCPLSQGYCWKRRQVWDSATASNGEWTSRRVTAMLGRKKINNCSWTEFASHVCEKSTTVIDTKCTTFNIQGSRPYMILVFLGAPQRHHRQTGNVYGSGLASQGASPYTFVINQEHRKVYMHHILASFPILGVAKCAGRVVPFGV